MAEPKGEPEPNNFKDMQELVKKIGADIINDYKNRDVCKNYDQAKAADLTHEITEAAIKKLSEHFKTYKFTVTCTLLNKKEGGLHMSSSCYWDNNTDGNVLIQDSNDALYFILNVFALY
jgi:dynein light chain Tctex-type 1